MKSKLINHIMILANPFLIGAAINFLPAWVSVPAVLLLALFWLGSWVLIAKENQ